MVPQGHTKKKKVSGNDEIMVMIIQRYMYVSVSIPSIVCIYIRESVDSLCRDGMDTPYTQYKINVSKSLQKISFKFLKGSNLHFRGFLQPTRLTKLPKSFAKVENWKLAELPVCSRSNSGFLFFFNEASSKLV